MRTAQAGFGVASMPNFSVREAVQRGTLMRVLPEWSLPLSRCGAVFPGRRLV
jgi:DNA-binding transcriptional LysR family regulator